MMIPPYYRPRGYIRRAYDTAVTNPVATGIGVHTIPHLAGYAQYYGGKALNAARNAYGWYRSNRTKVAGGKSFYRRRRGRGRQPKNKLKRAVRELQHQQRANEGELIYRQRQVGRNVIANNNECKLQATSGSSIIKVETVAANLRYFNPASPGTLTTVDFTSGSISKSVRMKLYSKIRLRNNYHVACKVDLYCVVPKQDTSTAAVTAISNGFADIGGVSVDSSLMWPSDSPMFQQLWKIVKHRTIHMMPGKETSMSFSKPAFDYDPSVTDSQSDTFQPKFGSHQYLIRVSGILAHDSAVATEEGFSKGGVDWSIVTVYNVKYAAGADIKYIVVDDDADTFTNTPNVTQYDTQQETFSV